MSATPPNPYLQPWSIVSDEELRLLRELRSLVDACRLRWNDEVLYMQGGLSLKIGRIGEIVRDLRDIGK